MQRSPLCTRPSAYQTNLTSLFTILFDSLRHQSSIPPPPSNQYHPSFFFLILAGHYHASPKEIYASLIKPQGPLFFLFFIFIPDFILYLPHLPTYFGTTCLMVI